MERVVHGSTSAETTQSIGEEEVGLIEGSGGTVPKGLAPPPVRFGFMFPELSNDIKFLIAPSDKVLSDLALLGSTMEDPKDLGTTSDIPSIYTYFLQFIDHDITFTHVTKPAGVTDSEMLGSPDLTTWTKAEISAKVSNKRSKQLQLETVYGNISDTELPPRIGEEFLVNKVTPISGKPPGKDDFHDLMRRGPSLNPRKDRAALIGDPRNDSHLILSQLHVAFLRSHNAIVKATGCTFAAAKLELQRLYQWIIFYDVLPRLVRQEEIDLALNDPLFNPAEGIPFEFSVGAFRFGHSMVRSSYYLNDDFFHFVSLEKLFMLTILSNSTKPTPSMGCLSLPSYRILEWKKFLDLGRNVARRIRPQMVEPLAKLLDEANVMVKGETRLAVQDLKRAYMLRIPCGQAMADRLACEKLTDEDLIAATVSTAQSEVLTSSGFLKQTPLWFYILAEADKVYRTNGNDKFKLGPVGGRLVAEVLIGLIKSFPDSFMNTNWRPKTTNNKFMIPDLLKLAGVLEK